MADWVPCTVAVLLAAGCVSIAGLDGDYRLGGGGAGGTTASTTAPSASTSSSSAGGGGAAQSSTAATGGGGSASCPGVHEVVAVVADCIDLTVPDPDYCETTTGLGTFQIDALLSVSNSPRHAFLRFDLDPSLVENTLTSIVLRLVVATTTNADSDDSGEVWQVAPFARPDLFAGDVANAGTAPSANTVGAVALGQIVEWSLPTTVVDGTSVYLALRPISSNFATYVNLHGAPADAPRLVVTCR